MEKRQELWVPQHCPCCVKCGDKTGCCCHIRIGRGLPFMLFSLSPSQAIAHILGTWDEGTRDACLEAVMWLYWLRAMWSHSLIGAASPASAFESVPGFVCTGWHPPLLGTGWAECRVSSESSSLVSRAQLGSRSKLSWKQLLCVSSSAPLP